MDAQNFEKQLEQLLDMDSYENEMMGAMAPYEAYEDMQFANSFVMN